MFQNGISFEKLSPLSQTSPIIEMNPDLNRFNNAGHVPIIFIQISSSLMFHVKCAPKYSVIMI